MAARYPAKTCARRPLPGRRCSVSRGGRASAKPCVPFAPHSHAQSTRPSWAWPHPLPATAAMAATPTRSQSERSGVTRLGDTTGQPGCQAALPAGKPSTCILKADARDTDALRSTSRSRDATRSGDFLRAAGHCRARCLHRAAGWPTAQHSATHISLCELRLALRPLRTSKIGTLLNTLLSGSRRSPRRCAQAASSQPGMRQRRDPSGETRERAAGLAWRGAPATA
jgi:hypothetical protein